MLFPAQPRALIRLLCMKRLFFFVLFFVALGWNGPLRAADTNVRAVQTKLKQDGFYFGDPTGVYDNETAAAVTRYQIRNGLPISGRLDAETARSLGVAPSTKAVPEPSTASGTWRRLRNGEMQFLPDANQEKSPSAKGSAAASPRPSAAPGRVAHVSGKAQLEPPPPPPQLAQGSSPALAPEPRHERLRDYVGAFVLAGLDPRVGSELEFFADRVNYFGEPNVGREKIRRDLVRYDTRWPERRFWLAGNLEVRSLPGGWVRVTFPLRYELRSRSKQASGEVLKTLTLRPTGNGDFEIVAVREERKGKS